MPASEQQRVCRQSFPFTLQLVWPSFDDGRFHGGAKVASGTAGTVGSISADGPVGSGGRVATGGTVMSTGGIGGKATISPAILLGVKEGRGDVVGGNGGCPGMASSLKLWNFTESPQRSESVLHGPFPSDPLPSSQSISLAFQ